MEETKCIFCNRQSDHIIVEENGYAGVKCSHCDLIYISPRPTQVEMLNMYGEDQGIVSAEMHMSGYLSYRIHARHNLAIINKYIKNGSLLELGAGAGFFVDEAKKRFDVCAIEPNKTVAEFISKKRGIPCETDVFNDSSFGGMNFNIIYHCNVLSHLNDPIADFKKMNSRLKNNGYLIFETGNIGEISDKHLSRLNNFGFPDHLFLFGKKSLRKLLKVTGFECVKLYTYSIVGNVLVQKLKVQIKKLLKRDKEFATTSERIVNKALTSQNTTSGLKWTKDGYNTFLCLFRYTVGAILPKKGRPQSIIVVARKTSE